MTETRIIFVHVETTLVISYTFAYLAKSVDCRIDVQYIDRGILHYVQHIYMCTTTLWVLILNSNLYHQHRLRLIKCYLCINKILVGLQVRIRQNLGVFSDVTTKTRPHVTYSRCGTIKIPPCSIATGAEQRSNLCSPSPTTVTSPRDRNVLSWDINNKQTNKQK